MNVSPILPRCPHCHSDKRQTKAGRTKYHSARFHCTACDKDYTPEPKQQGYDAPTRQQAVALRTWKACPCGPWHASEP